jgi:outer membrane protein assembly factor BamB
VGDVVYLCNNGPLMAVDAKTGQVIYRESRQRQIHRSNMVAADGKVYIVGRDGKADVVQAGREFKVLASNALPDKFLASPAVSGGRIYLRGYEHLWVIGTK